MNLNTLNISRQQASEAIIHYRAALKLRRNAEDEAILRGYKQVLKGRKLIELSKIITAGGADHNHRPRLALARADQKTCEVSVRCDGSIVFNPNVSYRSPLRKSFASDTLPRFAHSRPWELDGLSVVPLIPPQHRPVCNLNGYHILFEATWDDVPRDPALLKHLGGDLWAVLAIWNLSDLERAVLSGRRSS